MSEIALAPSAPQEADLSGAFIAGRSAAGQAAIDDQFNNLITNSKTSAPAAQQQAPQEGQSAPGAPEGNWLVRHGMINPGEPLAANSIGGVIRGVGEKLKSMFTGPSLIQQTSQVLNELSDWRQQFEQQNGRPPTIGEEVASPAGQKNFQIAQTLATGFAGGGIVREGLEPSVTGLPKAEAAQTGQPLNEMGEGAQPIKPGAEGSTPEVQPKAPEPSLEGAAPAKEAPAEPAKPILPLGDPLEPAFRINTAGHEEAAVSFLADQGERASLEATAAPIDGQHTGPTPQEINDYFAGKGPNPVRINLARIGSGEDIGQILADVSRTIPENAVQSNVATIQLADALGVSPEDLLQGYRGKNLNAAETTAMRFMLDSSADQMMKYAAAAADPMAGPEATATFMKSFAVHRSLQLYADNARLEAGRTLQSWSIMSQTRSSASSAIAELVRSADKDGAVSDLAAQMVDVGNPLNAGKLAASAMKDTTGRSGFLKFYYNVLLSNPRTIIKKLASDTAMAMWNVATRYTAENFPGMSGAVAPGETGALIYGYGKSFMDAIRAGGKALASGESQFFKDYQSMDAIGRSNLRTSLLANGLPDIAPEQAPTATGVDYLKSVASNGWRPTSWIGAADDFAKVWNYRAELYSGAFRKATTGGAEPEAAYAAAQDAVDKIGSGNIPYGAHKEAEAAALRTTFQEPLTGISQKVAEMADAINIPVPHSDYQIPLGRIIAPFVKIPANIARFSYYNSPLGAIFPNSVIKAQLAAGGATKDLCVARLMLGSAVATSLADAALNGTITGRGPSDPSLNRAWRAAGNEPYSIQMQGSRPIGYNPGVEPFSLMMGAIADTFNTMKFAKETDAEPMATSLMFGVGNAMLSKTYFSGISSFFDALQQPDKDSKTYVDRLIAGLTVPAGISGLEQATDHFVRQHYDAIDTIESRLPYISQNLPPKRTLWGDPIQLRDAFVPFMSDTGAARMLSPVPLGTRPDSVEPIDKWIWANRKAFRADEDENGALGLNQIGTHVTYMNGKLTSSVELTPEAHDRLQVLAGNELKEPGTGMGAKDTLNALVQGNYPNPNVQGQWDNSSAPMQAIMVKKVIADFRGKAKQVLLQEYPDVREAVQANWADRAQQLAPR